MSTEEKKQEVKALVEKRAGRLVAIASTETKDRVGDIVKVGGWDLNNFLKNPVLMFAHKYSEPPIGIATNIKKKGKKLEFEPVFHEITQLSREIKQMYENDPPIMRAFSVGFLPKKFDEKDMHVITEQELLEISAVPVPANAEALIEVAKGMTDDEKSTVEEWVKKSIVEDVEKEESGQEEEKKEEIKQEEVDIVEKAVEEKKEELSKEVESEQKKEEEKVEVKSPACRMENETKKECVARKIPEIMEEDPAMDNDQAVAIANSICDKKCGAKKDGEETTEPKEEEQKPSCECPAKEKEEVSQDEVLRSFVEKVKEEMEREQKEGRVLSGKNRKLIEDTVSKMDLSVSVLRELLVASEPQAQMTPDKHNAIDEGGETKKGRAGVAQEPLKDRVTVRALQKMSGELSQILNRIKQKNEQKRN